MFFLFLSFFFSVSFFCIFCILEFLIWSYSWLDFTVNTCCSTVADQCCFTEVCSACCFGHCSRNTVVGPCSWKSRVAVSLSALLEFSISETVSAWLFISRGCLKRCSFIQMLCFPFVSFTSQYFQHCLWQAILNYLAWWHLLSGFRLWLNFLSS